MKMSYKMAMVLPYLSMSSIFISCKKNSNNAVLNKGVTCTLTSMTVYGNGYKNTFAIQRDTQGRIACVTLLAGPSIISQRSFQYSSNEVVITNKDTGGTKEIDSLTLNNAGDITRWKRHLQSSFSGNTDHVKNMQYDANGHLISYQEDKVNYQCVWQNGDMIAAISNIDTQRYSYTNEPFSIEDGNEIYAVMELGQPLFKTAHLHKNIYDIDSTAYSYMFDSNGKISSSIAYYDGRFYASSQFSYDCH